MVAWRLLNAPSSMLWASTSNCQLCQEDYRTVDKRLLRLAITFYRKTTLKLNQVLTLYQLYQHY